MDTAPGQTTIAGLPLIPDGASKYEILGVPVDATQDQLKIAYRRMALLYHPDRHAEVDRAIANDIFKRISAAYRTLSNETERRRYDVAMGRGDHFHERANEFEVGLRDILAEIDIYEHIFSDSKLAQLNTTLKEIVDGNLIDALGERVIGVWPMPSAPAGVSHQGTYSAGAVVLTNLRILLPFTYTWEETRGNTKYKHTGASMPLFALPAVEHFSIISSGRVRNTVWIDIHYGNGSTRFRPGERNLSKLLLVARLWGIKVQGLDEDKRSEEFKWALWGSWKLGLGCLVLAIIASALIGLLWGGFLDNPIELLTFLSTDGRWSWLIILCGVISSSRLWRWILAYESSSLLSCLAASGDSLRSSALAKR